MYFPSNNLPFGWSSQKHIVLVSFACRMTHVHTHADTEPRGHGVSEGTWDCKDFSQLAAVCRPGQRK